MDVVVFEGQWCSIARLSFRRDHHVARWPAHCACILEQVQHLCTQGRGLEFTSDKWTARRTRLWGQVHHRRCLSVRGRGYKSIASKWTAYGTDLLGQVMYLSVPGRGRCEPFLLRAYDLHLDKVRFAEAAGRGVTADECDRAPLAMVSDLLRAHGRAPPSSS